jgi:hypothetical protein
MSREILPRENIHETIVGAADSSGKMLATGMIVGFAVPLVGAYFAYKFYKTGHVVAAGVTAVGSILIAPKVALAVSDIGDADQA